MVRRSPGAIERARKSNRERMARQYAADPMYREKVKAYVRQHPRTPTQTSWMSMIQRCENPKSSNYARYGGRGIRVEYASFEKFLADVGERPPGTTIDRIDNDGNYAPGNCRWATRSEQQKNKRLIESHISKDSPQP